MTRVARLLLVLAGIQAAAAGTARAAEQGLPASRHGDCLRQAGVVDAARVEARVRELSSFGSRVPGYPGHERARQYVRAALDEILGPERVTSQSFSLATPVDEGASVTLPDGSAHELFCIWPNLVATPTLPPEGLAGTLVYGRAGTLADLAGLEVEGSVLLLDFTSGDNWLKAAELGAAAVIFREEPPAEAGRGIERVEAEKKFVSAPVSVPRFYAEAETGQALLDAAAGAPRVTVSARMTWRSVAVQNIIAAIEGSDPELKWQRVIVAAPYDSISVVPALAPGAENACSIAGLLEVARVLREHPPRRTVLLLASASRYQSMAGVAAFVRMFDAANTNQGYRRQSMTMRAEIDVQRRRLPQLEELAAAWPQCEQIQAVVQQTRDDVDAKGKTIAEYESLVRVMSIRDFDTPLDARQAALDCVKAAAAAHRRSPQLTAAIAALETAIADARRSAFRLRSALGDAGQARAMGRDEREAAAREIDGRADHLERALRAARALNERFASDRGYFTGLVARAKRERNETERQYGKSAKVPDRRKVTSFFISLDLSAGGRKLGLFNRGSYDDDRDIYRQREYVPLGRTLRSVVFGSDSPLGTQREGICRALGHAYPQAGVDPAERFTETISGRNEETIETYFPEPIALESEPASFVMPGLTVLTCNDARLRTDTPQDLPDTLNFANLAEQLRLLAPLLCDIARDESIDLRVLETRRLCGPVKCRVVRLDQTRNLVPDTPVPGAVGVVRLSLGRKGAFFRGFPKPLYGVHASAWAVADADGVCDFSHFPARGSANLQAFGLNAQTGDIEYAPDLGAEGNAKYNFNEIFVPSVGGGTVTCVVFECRAVSLVGFTDPRYLLTLQYLQVLDARSETEPQFFGYTLAQATKFDTSSIEAAAAVFLRPGTRFKLTMSLGQVGKRLILINSTDAQPQGEGFLADRSRVLPLVSYRVASDVHRLDTSRLALLERNGIVSTNLVHLHALAGKFLAAADAARAQRDWQVFDRQATNAWAYESRVYPDVIAVSNDVVKGVIFYLALVVPFAVFMERLLFAFADIRRRIACVAVIFAAVLAILALVHPAMRITMTPFLIFLAFAILLLGALVSGIVLLKFNVELNKLKGGMVAMRQMDVSRLSAAFAAFNLGASYMRRRKVKTTLTCITLVLLTFTVLSFTSIKTFTRYNRFPLPWGTVPYEGILYRNLGWSPLERPELDRFAMELGGDFVVAPRAWIVSERVEEYVSYGVSTGEGESYRSTQAQAFVGLTPDEPLVTRVDRSLAWGRWLAPGERNACLIPAAMAGVLGVTPQADGRTRLRFLGDEFTVVGVFRHARGEGASLLAFGDVTDIDDAPLMPVSFKISRPVFRRRDEAVQTLDAVTQDNVYLNANGVVVIPFETALERGATIRSVAAVPRVPLPGGLDARLTQLMTSWSVAVFAGIRSPYERGGEGGGEPAGYLYSSIGATALGNVGNLVLPIALAGLIILNTMLGSVYERGKEIWTYSSVGLSPVHISVLFIAESCVYAVIGSIAGYLLGQVVAHFTMGQSGLMVNYSSMSTVFAVFLVMAVTVASSVYPAVLAHKLATPDIARTWQVSEPKGDRWELSLPFVVTAGQAAALNAYLKDFVECHTEESVGRFFAKDIAIEVRRDGGRSYSLRFACWLAPYDFGVSQEVEIQTLPAETDAAGIAPDVGEMTFRMLIRRLSGDDASWWRTNRVFLNTLRKTFLVWRILKPKDRQAYEELGMQLDAANR